MSSKVSFYNQGCRLNQAETSVMEKQFKDLGHQVVSFGEHAHWVVVNTCTVTENGDSDTRRLVNRINKQLPEAKIALVGCQSQVLKEKLATLKNVKWIVGNGEKMDIAQLMGQHPEPAQPLIQVSKLSNKTFSEPSQGRDEKHTRANLKIQDGCDFYCSFCVIPFARGPARSRDFNDVVNEAKSLVRSGHKEIVLTGINVGTYDESGRNIQNVIETLNTIEGLSRIRISSIEPTTVPFSLISSMNNNKVCRHLHLPLQSASDVVLQGMARKYSFSEYKKFVLEADKTVKDLCIGTDVIVGFPGETDDEFELGYQRLKSLPFAYFHVFSYSERPFARSKKREQQVEKSIVAKRSKKLRQLSSEKRLSFITQMLGKTVEVLVEQKKSHSWVGHTDNFVKVAFESDQRLKNTMVKVKLKSCDETLAYGDLII